MAYDNPRGIIAATVILQLISLTCVGLRLYSGHRRRIPIGASDWLIIAASICAIGLSAMEIYGESGTDSDVQAFVEVMGNRCDRKGIRISYRCKYTRSQVCNRPPKQSQARKYSLWRLFSTLLILVARLNCLSFSWVSLRLA